MGHLLITSSCSHFCNKTDLELYLNKSTEDLQLNELLKNGEVRVTGK